jgi:hypothetical protein
MAGIHSMSKKSGSRPGGIEIQRGQISLDEQYCGKFRREPEMTREDIRNNEMRQDGKRLTFHEPKR